MPSRCLLPFYYCSWGRRAALPPPPARFATRSLLHANGVTHEARSARHSQRKGAACGQRHGTAARGISHALPKIPQALQRAESSTSRAQGTMSVGCTRPPPATPRRLCEVLHGRRSLRAMIQKRSQTSSNTIDFSGGFGRYLVDISEAIFHTYLLEKYSSLTPRSTPTPRCEVGICFKQLHVIFYLLASEVIFGRYLDDGQKYRPSIAFKYHMNFTQQNGPHNRVAVEFFWSADGRSAGLLRQAFCQ